MDIGRRLERIATMPAGTVHYHHDVFIRVTRRDFVEKQLHAVGVDVGQYQTVEFSRADIDCPIGIGVLVYWCVSMARHTGRSGLGAQHLRMSEMRPKRASSWNIRFMGLPWAQSLRISASASGRFFSTRPAPVGRFAGGACRERAFSSYGGAAGCKPTPAPP